MQEDIVPNEYKTINYNKTKITFSQWNTMNNIIDEMMEVRNSQQINFGSLKRKSQEFITKANNLQDTVFKSQRHSTTNKNNPLSFDPPPTKRDD